MTSHERDRIASLERQWDRYLSGIRDVSGVNDEMDLISRLHSLDDAPPAPDAFRQRLSAELQRMYPERRARRHDQELPEAADQEDAADRRGPRIPVALHRPGSLRQWVELAAMVLILIGAIAGAALYSDDAYDFAQRQLAADTDDEALSDEREQLEQEGRVDGLTFEQAQALTPFEMVEPTDLPAGASIVDHSVNKSELVERGRLHLVSWRGTIEIALNNDAPPILIRQQPAMENLPVPMPRDEGETEPTGRLQTVEIGGTGTVRVSEQADGNEVNTHYVWRQGDVDVWIEIPFDDSEPDSAVDGLDQMLASIAEQGALDDGASQIASRGMTMNQLREAMPTVPVADPTPEHLELRRLDNSFYGPHFFYEHTASMDVGEIWIRAMGPTVGSHFHERVAETMSGTMHIGDVPVSHHVLMDRFAPETAQFIERVGLHVDLLLPWISGDSDTALAIYMWNVAGQSYLMGVAVPSDLIDAEAQGEPLIETDRPESDWLEIIAGQVEFAAEHLDPEEIFPVLAREATDQDQIPGQEIEDSRLIHATSDARYYLAYDSDRNTITLYQFVEVEGEEAPRTSGGGNAIWQAAEYGVVQQMGGGGHGIHVAWLLPQGYDEVLDEDGNVIGEVEDRLFAFSFGEEQPLPQALIAHGPAGELRFELQ